MNLYILMTGDLIICPSFSLMPIALETAIAVDQAVYYCVYLALAVVNQCQMVTADQRFYNVLSNDRLFSYLLWIENLP